jgi:hypothetical protein
LKHAIFLTLIILTLYGSMYGQVVERNPNLCNTKSPQYLKIYTQEQMNRADTDYPFVIRIYAHILRDNNGSNAATTEAQMYIDIQNMANFFKPHNICFMLMGFEYVNNTYLNNSINPGNSSDEAALKSNNKHGNAIDIYIHKNFGVASGGYAYDIPSDVISVVQSSNFNFWHEMGHALGLYHTFETANGEACPDGSDCSYDGDLICDTNTDFAGSQNNVAPGNPCIYIGTQTVNCLTFPFSDIQTYNPPTNNIMSYWVSCYTQFTPLQGVRMRTTIANEQIVNKCLLPLNESLYATNGDLYFYNDFYIGARNELTIGTQGTGYVNFLGGGTANKIIKAGTRVRLKAGTRIYPVGGSTKITLNTLCN